MLNHFLGFEAFYEASKGKLKEIAVFTSASEGFSFKNTNCTISESLQRLSSVVKAAQEKDIKVRAYVSCVAKCPYDGNVDPEMVSKVSSTLLNLGCYEISLGDTIGAATPST